MRCKAWAAPLFFQRGGVITGLCAAVVKDIQRRIGDRIPLQV